MNRVTFSIVSLVFLIPGAYAETKINVWTYYPSPPFSVPKDGLSLTQILCKELTNKSNGKWVFEPKYLPRKRINHNLAQGKSGIVLWASPVWFGDKEESKYDWTERVVWGQNEIVSLKGSSIEYTGPESMKGKRFGGVFGHYYKDIDEYVESKQITRNDTSSFQQNFDKLINERLDVIVIPRGELFHIMNKKGAKKDIYISKKPHQKYQRKILVTKDLVDVRDYINSQISKGGNQNYENLLKKYGLSK
ncbi:transporter substrate-binding domain-containing protein [Vibrio profundum]|uniref:hypothetical protein n=1 Tax=Vibrio profundum TaxID=2910247 RepID=UPI003D0BD51A